MTEEEWLDDDGQLMMQVGPFIATERKLRLTALSLARLIPGSPSELPLDIVNTVEDATDSEITADHWPQIRNQLHDQFAICTGTGSRAVDWAMQDLVERWSLANGPITFYLGFDEGSGGWWDMNSRVAKIIRDIFGNPFRPVAFNPAWRTSTAVAIAQGMYESRDFSAMPILADALQDAGCDHDDILTHCRDASGVHVRGCWVVDHVLGKA